MKDYMPPKEKISGIDMFYPKYNTHELIRRAKALNELAGKVLKAARRLPC